MGALGVSAYAPLSGSRISSSRVARSATVEMVKKSVGDLTGEDLKGKKVLVRCDLNVPLDGKTITDDTRIRASIPTVKYLMENGAKVLLASHLGRPKSGPEDKFSLSPVAPRLSELLGKDVTMAPDCIGDGVAECVDKMAEGDVLLLDYLDGAVSEPKRPFAAIVGGSKVSSKIGVIESLMEKVDKIVIGGGMVFTFLKARGLETGSSLVEEDQLELASKLEKIAAEKGIDFILP